MSLTLFRRVALCSLTIVLSATGTAVHAQNQQVANELLERIGVVRGVVSILGGDDQTAIDIADGSQLLLHVRRASDERAQALRQKAARSGLGIDRIVVQRGARGRLPLASNSIDAVVAPQVKADLLRAFTSAELVHLSLAVAHFSGFSRCAVSLGGMPDELPVMEMSVP